MSSPGSGFGMQGLKTRGPLVLERVIILGEEEETNDC